MPIDQEEQDKNNKPTNEYEILKLKSEVEDLEKKYRELKNIYDGQVSLGIKIDEYKCKLESKRKQLNEAERDLEELEKSENNIKLEWQ